MAESGTFDPNRSIGGDIASDFDGAAEGLKKGVKAVGSGAGVAWDAAGSALDSAKEATDFGKWGPGLASGLGITAGLGLTFLAWNLTQNVSNTLMKSVSRGLALLASGFGAYALFRSAQGKTALPEGSSDENDLYSVAYKNASELESKLTELREKMELPEIDLNFVEGIEHYNVKDAGVAKLNLSNVFHRSSQNLDDASVKVNETIRTYAKNLHEQVGLPDDITAGYLQGRLEERFLNEENPKDVAIRDAFEEQGLNFTDSAILVKGALEVRDGIAQRREALKAEAQDLKWGENGLPARPSTLLAPDV